MPTMNRKEAIAAVRAAGYHNDGSAGLQAYIAARMSYGTYARELKAGRDDRADNKPCPCALCTMSDAAEVAADFAGPERTPLGVEQA
jgi:hypothetical protein